MTSKRTKLPNDYERMIPEYHKGTEVYGEHVARYAAVDDIVKGKTVLDIACGSGYGTKMIAKNAKKVTGVDVLEDSIKYARENYNNKNIDYFVGDAEKLPLKDRSVDVVVSFETIEHVKGYIKFMEEIKRVLKEGGLLILSTPNELEFAEGNHFHLHEFEHDELLKLVKKYFKNVTPYYQATWISSLVGDQKLMSGEWDGSLRVSQTAPISPEKILYFYFLCSDREIAETIESHGVLGEHWSERKKVEAESKQLLTDQHVRNLEAIITSLKAELSHAKDELASIKKSRTYKLAKKVSKIKPSSANRSIKK